MPLSLRSPLAAYGLIAALISPPVAATTYHTVSRRSLGEQLFNDPRFSSDGKVSCATCHRQDSAYSDRLPVSVGVEGKHGTRNAPSLLVLKNYSGFFWEGRAESLEAQVSSPLLSPVEMGLSSMGDVEQRLRTDPKYCTSFHSAFPDHHGEPTFAEFSVAIVAFEESLDPGVSAYDRFRDGDSSALTPSAKSGLGIFTGRGQCARCHTLTDTAAPFTDGAFHEAGGASGEISPNLAQIARDLSALDPVERDRRISESAEVAGTGRFVVTLDPKDIGTFRTPSLRNVAVTAPYMHDGSIATLPEAIEWELYVRGGELARPIDLSPSERSDLLNFLTALTSDAVKASPAR